MKRLLILRHAKSSWADSSQTDWQRPLNERGVRDAPRAGRWLLEHKMVPDLIISSDAVRAHTTAQAVARTAGYSRDIVRNPSLYLATPDDMLDVLNAVSDDAGSVMIVGHNPGLEDLVQVLTGEHHAVPTAAIVAIELSIDRWRDLDGTVDASIAAMWRPKDD